MEEIYSSYQAFLQKSIGVKYDPTPEFIYEYEKNPPIGWLLRQLYKATCDNIKYTYNNFTCGNFITDSSDHTTDVYFKQINTTYNKADDDNVAHDNTLHAKVPIKPTDFDDEDINTNLDYEMRKLISEDTGVIGADNESGTPVDAWSLINTQLIKPMSYEYNKWIKQWVNADGTVKPFAPPIPPRMQFNTRCDRTLHPDEELMNMSHIEQSGTVKKMLLDEIQKDVV